MSPEETSAHDDNNMRLLNADEERRRMSPGFFLEEEDVGVVVADMGGGCGGTTTRKGHPSNDVDENAIAADGSPSPGGTRRRKPSVGGMTTRTDATRGTSSTITEESLMLGGGMGGGNVWTRFLSRRVTLWDKLETTSGMNVDDVNYDDVDGDDDDDSREGMDHDPSSSSGCKVAVQTCVLTMWYEAMHFGGTIMAHPRILLMSTIAFGLARETAQWFADEFQRAMLPLYSIQQGVIHSGYFDDLSSDIGPYPNLVISNDDDDITDAIGDVRRNVTGICDNRDLVNRWRDIVVPVNSENDLDGIVVGYRLFPNNVACLTEPNGKESTSHFDAFDMPQGDSPIASDVIFGYDHGNSDNMMSRMITTDLFINKKLNVFGPVAMAPMTELICGHLAIWRKPDIEDASNERRRTRRGLQYELNVDVALEAAMNDTTAGVSCPSPHFLKIHGTCVEDAWGFVGNFLDWKKLKDRSDIYSRFSESNFDFHLSRVSGPTMPGMDVAVLAESPRASLLDDANSIVVFTESLHGTWQNRVGIVSGWEAPWYNTAIVCVVLGSLLLGLLTASMLVERQNHRNLLYKIMPKKAIAKLSRGQTVAESFNIVTIFFCDIVGYTSIVGGMSPRQVMKMLNELYMELDILVAKHQVYKVETIGDAYMVVGGAPERVLAPLAAQRVALFAIDAIDLVKTFRTRDGEQLFIRAGLASGPAVAGVIGKAMPRYCFFGDTVNFASRMETTSKKMRIQCADITCRLLRDAPGIDFHLTKRTEGDIVGVDVKGKGRLITYWIDGSSIRIKKDPMLPASPSNFQPAREHDIETSKVSSSSREAPLEMFTSAEIYQAVTTQDWEKLGHADSALVCAATDDRKTMNFRATALLEHHLDRVIKKRDPEANISLSTRIQLSKFVDAISQTYGNAKFHSYEHAIHVMTSLNKLLSFALTEDPLNSLSIVFSALIHDAGHTGMSNQILRDTIHPLSEKFEKDVPIAERNSIDLGLSILFRTEYQALRDAIIPDEMDKIEFGKTLFQTILITDIATPENVKSSIRRHEACRDVLDSLTDDLCPCAHYFSDLLDGFGLAQDVIERHPADFSLTHEGLQHCVRNEHLMLLSDIAHLLQGWANFVKWNFRLYRELYDCFRKGMCLDPRLGWYEGQIIFLDKYVLPLAQRSKRYLREDFADALLSNGLTNRRIWTERGKLASDILSKAVADDEKEIDVLHRLYELPALE